MNENTTPTPQDTGLPPRDPQAPILPPVAPATPAAPEPAPILPPVATPEEIPAAPAPVALPPGSIVVDAAKLKALMDRLDEQAGQMARLEAAASKAGLANWDNKHKAKPGKAVNVRTFEGKVILGWRTVSNLVEKNPDTKVWTENQIIELIFEDDTTIQIPYITWVNRYAFLAAEVKATTVLEDETIVYTLKLPDGREVKLGQTFVN